MKSLECRLGLIREQREGILDSCTERFQLMLKNEVKKRLHFTLVTQFANGFHTGRTGRGFFFFFDCLLVHTSHLQCWRCANPVIFAPGCFFHNLIWCFIIPSGHKRQLISYLLRTNCIKLALLYNKSEGIHMSVSNLSLWLVNSGPSLNGNVRVLYKEPEKSHRKV